jgi:hypothetical protein
MPGLGRGADAAWPTSRGQWYGEACRDDRGDDSMTIMHGAFPAGAFPADQIAGMREVPAAVMAEVVTRLSWIGLGHWGVAGSPYQATNRRADNLRSFPRPK